MDKILDQINTEVYDQCSLEISDFYLEPESKEYGACRFALNGLSIIARNAKITPNRNGQFVTFWKRKANGPIRPFDQTDQFHFYIVNVRTENRLGQFVFSKSKLIERGIISTAKKEGKRAFRVYPIWDIAISKQAILTQKWQLNYFYEIGEKTNFDKVRALYTEL